MLVTVNFFEGRMFREAERPTWANITVHAINIGIGMVHDVVLHKPNENMAAKQVHTRTHQLVFPRMTGIGTVDGIVHDAHADARCTDAHDDHQEQGQPCAHWHCDYQNKRDDVHGKHGQCLDPQRPIALGRDGFFSKILVNIPSQGNCEL